MIIQSNFCLDRINEQTKNSMSLHWQFSAHEEKLARFREVRDLTEKKIREWVAEQHVIVEP